MSDPAGRGVGFGAVPEAPVSGPPERFMALVRRERRRRRAVGVGAALSVVLAAGMLAVLVETPGGGGVGEERGPGPRLAREAGDAPARGWPRAFDHDAIDGAWGVGGVGGAGGMGRAGEQPRPVPRAGDAARWLRESGDGELCCV